MKVVIKLIKNIENIEAFLDALTDSENDKVEQYYYLTEDEAEGYVEDAEGEEHNVSVYKGDITESTCTCENFEKKGICRHIVKLYYHLFPEEFESDLHEAFIKIDDNDLKDEIANLPLYYHQLMENTLNELDKEDLVHIILENVKLWTIPDFMEIIEEYRKTYENKDVGDNLQLILEQLYMVMQEAYKELTDEKITKYSDKLTKLTLEQIDFVLNSKDEDYITDLKFGLITTPFCGHPLYNEFLKRVIEYFDEEELNLLDNIIKVSIDHFSFMDNSYILSNALITKHLYNEVLNQVDIENDLIDIFTDYECIHFIRYIINYYLDDFDKFLNKLEEFVKSRSFGKTNFHCDKKSKYNTVKNIQKIVKNEKLIELLNYCKKNK